MSTNGKKASRPEMLNCCPVSLYCSNCFWQSVGKYSPCDRYGIVVSVFSKPKPGLFLARPTTKASKLYDMIVQHLLTCEANLRSTTTLALHIMTADSQDLITNTQLG